MRSSMRKDVNWTFRQGQLSHNVSRSLAKEHVNTAIPKIFHQVCSRAKSTAVFRGSFHITRPNVLGTTQCFLSTLASAQQDRSQDATQSTHIRNITPTNRVQKFQKMHDRLLKVPLQEYTPQLWAEGKNTLYFWMSQLSQEIQDGEEVVYKPVARHKEVNVNLCIQLLDRWALEEKAPPDDIFEGSTLDLLNQIVNRWRVSWKHNQTNLTPAKMLEKLESYLESNNWLTLDSKTLNMVLDGAGHQGSHVEWDLKRAPLFSEGVLAKMDRDYGVTPTEFSYTSVVHTWAKSGIPNAPLKAEDLLRQVEQHDNVEPNNVLYCAVIDTWAKSSHPDAIQRIEALVKEMEDSPFPDVFPDTNVLNCLLYALALRTHVGGTTRRALGILQSMILAYEEDSATDMKPNQQCFCNVITAFARAGEASEAQNVLDEMQALYERTEDTDFYPDAWCYTAVLDAWAKQGNIEQAKVIIRRMQDLAETTGNASLMPTNVSMNALLHAMAREQKIKHGRRGDNDVVERAQAILQTMEDLYNNENRLEMKPDVISYGAVIDCYAKSNRSDAAEHCEALLRRMQEKADHGDVEMRPNTTIYSTVINAWSRSHQSCAPERAQALLQEMIEIAELTGDATMRPTRFSYTALLTAWARSKRRDALEKAQAVFNQLSREYQPSDLEYRALLNAWANRGDVEKMEKLLHKMLNDYLRHRKQNSEQPGPISNDDKKEQENEGSSSIMVPCTKSFNLLLSAYSKSRIPDAGRRAESLLVRMQQLHVKEGLPTQPDSISLGAVLHSWGRSRQKGAAERAESILRHSMTLSPHQKLKPNVICYNTVINAWAKSREERNQKEAIAARRAEELLKEMWQRYENNIDRSVRPDRITYTGCIAAWARSGHPNSAEKAQVLLDDMLTRSKEYQSLRPDSVVYRTVMKAWQQQGNEEMVRALSSKIEQENRHQLR